MSTELETPPTDAALPQGSPAAITIDLKVLYAMLDAVKADEAKELLRHEELMAQLATRRLKYSTTLSVLVEMYPSASLNKSNVDETNKSDVTSPILTQSHKSHGTEPSGKAGDSQSQTQPSTKAGMPRKREKHGVLKRALMDIFEQRNTFLTTEDFKKAFIASPVLKGYSSKRITDGLKDARRPGQGIIGIQAYSGAFPKFINGLSTFFEDAEGKHIKPEYTGKLQERLKELGLTLEKGGQATNGVTNNPLFQSPSMREANSY